MKSFNFCSFLSLFAVVFLVNVTGSKAQVAGKKMPLKVLYVGYDPQKPMPKDLVYYMTTSDRYASIYQTRMPAFKAFLEKNFSVVQVVDVRNYTPAMSDKVNVTIMDAGPVKLPATFDRPMVLIAAMAPNVGLPLGLKFDWYCQCLYGEALNLRTNHPIFNTPNKVNLTLVDKETPASFFNGFQGAKTPKTMARWRVVTEGEDGVGKPYLIGMVSHGEGFNDSPDAEVISGGVCWKNAEAVSIGRHGNYFMWGFAGSPEYMTAEANQVLVNSICYISKYDKKPAIVKKVQRETREGIDEIVYRLDKDLYDKALISRKEGNDRLKKFQQDLRDKKAAGENIGQANENLLRMPLTDDVQSFEDYVKGFVTPEMFAQFSTDMNLYHKFYHDNYEYFYPLNTDALQLDKDVQKLGISNRSIALLEKCISMLQKNETPDLAQRLLLRYTMQNFTTASQWSSWFVKNKSNLFFTEAGGFKFVVNSYNKPAVATLAKTPIKAATVKTNLPTTKDPVVVSAELVAGNDKNMMEVVIDATILKGWHLYAYVSKDDPFIVTEALLELPEGATKGEWKIPAGVSYLGNNEIFIYENKASFKIPVDCTNLKAGAILKCGLYYQVCDINKCYPPKKKMVSLVYKPAKSSNELTAAF
jgi:hypothetical protein